MRAAVLAQRENDLLSHASKSVRQDEWKVSIGLHARAIIPVCLELRVPFAGRPRSRPLVGYVIVVVMVAGDNRQFDITDARVSKLRRHLVEKGRAGKEEGQQGGWGVARAELNFLRRSRSRSPAARIRR